jgi:hypothetical protein
MKIIKTTTKKKNNSLYQSTKIKNNDPINPSNASFNLNPAGHPIILYIKGLKQKTKTYIKLGIFIKIYQLIIARTTLSVNHCSISVNVGISFDGI